jgi:uncharacterized OsmC-like protein
MAPQGTADQVSAGAPLVGAQPKEADPAAAAVAASIQGDRSVVTVRETRQGRLQQEIIAGAHRLLADEPFAVGGGDSGPNPYELLLAALGACTAMTLRLYAERKSLRLDRVTVRLRHAKIYAADCATCETKEGKVDRIEREIELSGALEAHERARLIEIADICPIHRTLTSEVEIATIQRINPP